MQLKKVVLPAPFGPMTLTIAPWSTSKSSSLTAISPPNRLVTPSGHEQRLIDIGSSRVIGVVSPRRRRIGRRPRQPHVQLAPGDPDGTALPGGQHHPDEREPVEQEAVVRRTRGTAPGRPMRKRAPSDDARDAAHAADDDDRGHVDRHEQVDAAREDRADEAGEDRAAEAGEGGAQHVRQQLGLDQVDADRLGDVLVLADRHPGPPDARERAAATPRTRRAPRRSSAM